MTGNVWFRIVSFAVIVAECVASDHRLWSTQTTPLGNVLEPVNRSLARSFRHIINVPYRNCPHGKFRNNRHDCRRYDWENPNLVTTNYFHQCPSGFVRVTGGLCRKDQPYVDPPVLPPPPVDVLIVTSRNCSYNKFRDSTGVCRDLSFVCMFEWLVTADGSCQRPRDIVVEPVHCPKGKVLTGDGKCETVEVANRQPCPPDYKRVKGICMSAMKGCGKGYTKNSIGFCIPDNANVPGFKCPCGYRSDPRGICRIVAMEKREAIYGGC